MSFEAISQFAAGVRFDGALPGIIARTGIAGVAVVGPGEYTVTLTDAIGGDAAVAHVAVEGQVPLYATASRIDAITWRVQIQDFADPVDATFNLSVYALTNRS